MSKDSLDLTGSWDGLYRYPAGTGPDTPFLCRIVEKAGTFDGSIIEPDTLGDYVEAVSAVISGHRSGRSIDFTKCYCGARVDYENPVDYVGQLSEDGTSITGVWSLQDWNGSFEMYRERGIEETQEARSEVTIELD